MKMTDLPSPGLAIKSASLHRNAVLALSHAELMIDKAAANTTAADSLAEFFHAALVKANAMATNPVVTSELETTQKIVSSGDTMAVKDGDATSVTGTITIAAGAITQVLVPATTALVNNASTVTVKDAAAKTLTGTVTVAAGVPTQVLIGATSTLVTTGFSTGAVAENAAGDPLGIATITIVDGVITKIKTSL